MMKVNNIIKFLPFVLCLGAHPTLSKESSSKSSSSVIGNSISASINYQAPATGVVGSGVELNLGHFVRFGVGVNAYVDSNTRMNGLQVAAIGYMSAVAWAVSFGKINFRKAYNFLNGTDPDDDMVAVLTPFADLKFFVPKWRLSPSAGIGYGNWIADPAGTTGLPADKTTDDYTYYTVGIDYVDDFGYLGAGFSYNPTLPAKFKTTPYVNLGAAFRFK